MLQTRNLTITMKKDLRDLLRDFTFSLNPGDKAAIIGEEGNGKSTLLKLLYDPALVEPVGRRLLALGGIYYTCHCTSQGAYARLKDIMGEKLRRLRAGDVAEI